MRVTSLSPASQFVNEVLLLDVAERLLVCRLAGQTTGVG
jgi:hypothetical protein